MIIVQHGKTNYHFTCPVRDCDNGDPDLQIPKFFSKKQAKDAGWVFTDDINFCPPDEDIVAVCPECAVENME